MIDGNVISLRYFYLCIDLLIIIRIIDSLLANTKLQHKDLRNVIQNEFSFLISNIYKLFWPCILSFKVSVVLVHWLWVQSPSTLFHHHHQSSVIISHDPSSSLLLKLLFFIVLGVLIVK